MGQEKRPTVLTHEEFSKLAENIPEPYCTMVHEPEAGNGPEKGASSLRALNGSFWEFVSVVLKLATD